MADAVTLDPQAPPEDATVVLRGLHVRYEVGGRNRPRLKDLFTRNDEMDERRQFIHAVRGIDLVARKGEAVGLVGRNGSGKSTTLQAMAGLLPPSEGEVLSVAQPVLLGVGAALESNLTGRRNIELGCLAMGMSGEDVENHMAGIIEFAELDEFIDLPLKTYSTGMRARLHFSIATAISPEILLIDEALAVGDQGFRRKSGKRIQELLDGAGTVFLVSHSLTSVEDACSRVIWIDKGQIKMDGDPGVVLEAYKQAY